MILLAAEGRTAPEIAPLVRRSDDTVQRVLRRYQAGATGHRAASDTGRGWLHRQGFVCKRPGWGLKRKATEQPDWAKNGSGRRRC